MSEADIQAALSAYFDGINSERYADVGALFAPEGELKAPGTRWLRGPDEVETYFSAALGPYPEHLDTPTRILISGSTATVEIHFKGALAGGIEIEFDAVDVFDFDDNGLFARLTSWYDSHDVRSRLREARKAAEEVRS
ncbi:MAG TPA: nuclear transport factor 2 family protein [Solirubrobacteraceae bacterium]|nr:nuclear transport factor 2 family protein [Solirubrobacteraceae bacterium]